MEERDYTITEWCYKRRVCRATFYNQKKKKKMPQTIKIGSRTIITAAADAKWERDREAEASGGAA
jgi:hypothetical protein